VAGVGVDKRVVKYLCARKVRPSAVLEYSKKRETYLEYANKNCLKKKEKRIPIRDVHRRVVGEANDTVSVRGKTIKVPENKSTSCARTFIIVPNVVDSHV